MIGGPPRPLIIPAWPKGTIIRYTGLVVLTLACPGCLIARERETIHLQQPSACPHCGTLSLFSSTLRLLVIRCQVCGTVYDRRSPQPAPEMRPVCPRCGAVPGRVTGLVDDKWRIEANNATPRPLLTEARKMAEGGSTPTGESGRLLGRECPASI